LNEWVGLAASFLIPHLAEAQALGQALGADQGRHPGRERGLRRALEREEVRVAPDGKRAGLDPPPRFRGVEPAQVVGHVERPEAHLAPVASVERIGLAAFLTSKRLYCHVVPFTSKASVRFA
jgi:hypothetical protein